MSDLRSEATATWLIAVCRDFGVQVESADDEILDSGTTSLTVMKIIARVEERYGIDVLPPEDLFEDSRVGVVATAIDRHRAEPSTGEWASASAAD